MKTEKIGLATIHNMDCMDFLKSCEDNQFDLAICDPPYFDGPQKKGYYKGTKQLMDVGDYKDLKATWEIPDQLYIDELKRVSKNQIIWGINYFKCICEGGRIVWIKGDEGSPFSMADIAYQSFYNRIDLFKCLWSGFLKDSKTKSEKRIHPTQKPVALYEWLLKNYAKEGDSILDTHGGSMSIAIATNKHGFDLTACELDEDYFKAACERIRNAYNQPDMFTPKETEKIKQSELL